MSLPWGRIVDSLRSRLGSSPLPSVSQIARTNTTPFHILISTMISLRTKDEVTIAASRRLFSVAQTPAGICALGADRIAELIFPAGFYRTKAANIRETSRLIVDEHAGRVPADLEALVALPGVGRKTANLVLGLGFGIEAICVDTHVHRIANRCGWVTSRSPDETERKLQEILPRAHWIEINELLVAYGQKVCTPVSPRCSSCVIARQCRRIGVERSR